jgi:hypothetical protein
MTKSLLESFGVGLVLQVLLLVLCKFVAGLGAFVLTYFYAPWINLAISISGEIGESAMIWPPVFGLVGGVLVDSIIVGVAFSFIKIVRRRST